MPTLTLRRVAAALLLGGFAEEIYSSLHWLASVCWRLTDVLALRPCLLAGTAFALDAALIYLALRGLARGKGGDDGRGPDRF